MEKFKNLSKGKKAGLGAIVLALVVVVGVVCGSLMANDTKKIVLDKTNLTGLIDKEYVVDSLKESADKKELEVSIKGDLTNDDLEKMAKSLNDKNISSAWKKEKMTVNVFAKDSKTTEKTDFYTEGLTNRIVVNTEKANADISSYTNVPAVEKTDALVDNTKGSYFKATDGNIQLSLDMALKDDLSIADIVQQAKTFTILFRETNSDKEIKSMELYINPNDNEKKYNFNTNYENILEVIDVVVF